MASRHGFADARTARELGVPAAVQDVVRRRIDLLPEETRKLLVMAAVLGVRIELDLLAHVAANSVPATLESLDPAIDAGLLAEDRQVAGQLRFAHALVADALVAELALSRRARLHAAAVEALEDLRPNERDDEYLARLAYHAAQGAVAGTGMQAVEYASRAARLATGRAQHEEAVAYWDQAIRLADLYERLLPHRGTLATCGPGGPVFGAVDQALARLALVIGDVTAARRHNAAAVELLDRIGARPWLARALLTEHTLLAESDDPADRAEAASVFDRCHRLAADLGLVPVLSALPH